MAVRAVPEDFHTVTPSLAASDAAKLIDFLKAAFGAEERMRMAAPDGKLMHAEVKIGDSIVMLGETGPGPAAASLFLYVNDVDAVYRRAIKAGATSAQEPSDMFWGDRMGAVRDQFGNHWLIATHKEDVAPQDLAKRAAAAMNR